MQGWYEASKVLGDRHDFIELNSCLAIDQQNHLREPHFATRYKNQFLGQKE